MKASSKLSAVDETHIDIQITDVDLIQRRRKQIVDAAVGLFATQGYDKTTVQEIAAKAGVSIGLIYQYARTKEDVLLLSLLSILGSYKTEIPKALAGETDPLRRLWCAVSAYCHVVDRGGDLTLLAYRSTKSLPKADRELIKKSELETNELLAACIRDCISAGVFRKVNVDRVVYHFVAFAHTWALKYWRLKSITTLEEYIESGFDFLISSMLVEKVSKRSYMSPPPRKKSPRAAAKRPARRAN